MAVKVVKQIMEKYGMPLENVVRHYDVTGKLCPEPFVKSKEKTDCQNRNGFRQRRKNDIWKGGKHMQIKEMLADSSNYTKGRKQNIQYIVVHYGE